MQQINPFKLMYINNGLKKLTDKQVQTAVLESQANKIPNLD